jgi:DNA invertase Pin-like site-specific DNA recombinase
MTKAYLYLRTSADDRDRKAGIEVQRAECTAYAARAGFEIVAEFVDDGVTGKLPMHSRPQGKLLIAALLADGVKTVLCYDSKRIGRTQPAFWSFVGQCRDIGVTVLDKDGADLRDSLKGGFEGLMAEMDYKATIERLAAGKRANRGIKRVEGRWPYGEHPRHEYDGEREVVKRILKMRAKGESVYAIAKTLNEEGARTRYDKVFKTQTVLNILARASQRPM